MKYTEIIESEMVDEINLLPRNSVNSIGIVNRCIIGHKMEYYGSYEAIKVFIHKLHNIIYFVIKTQDDDGDWVVIGGAVLKLFTDVGWMVDEIAVLHRDRGYGYMFYKFLLTKGFSIISGESQSHDGQNAWKKLMKEPNVSVTGLRLNDETMVPLDLKDVDPWSDPDIYLLAKAK